MKEVKREIQEEDVAGRREKKNAAISDDGHGGKDALEALAPIERAQLNVQIHSRESAELHR